MIPDQPPQPAPRYYDWYHCMSHKDFLTHVAAGTLNAGTISTCTVQESR